MLQDGAGNLGSFMVGRLGGLSVGVPDVNNGVMVRPGSTGSVTSLPPISKVSRILNLYNRFGQLCTMFENVIILGKTW